MIFILLVLTNVWSIFGVFITISITVTNFPKTTSMLLPILLAVYLSVAPEFGLSVRNSFFNNVEYPIYLCVWGTLIFIVFVLANFLWHPVEVKSKIVRRFSPDRLGLSIFLFVAALFVEWLFITKLVYGNWIMSFIFFMLLFISNLIGPYVLMKITKKEMKGVKALKHFQFKIKTFTEKEFYHLMNDTNYIVMAIVSAIIIGTWGTFINKTEEIAVSLDQTDSLKNMNNTVWISGMTAVFAGGLISVFWKKLVETYFFLFLATVFWSIGFGLALLSEIFDGVLLFNAAIFIGISYGMCWVLVPQTCLAGGGPLSFSYSWGLVLAMDFIGMVISEFIFTFLYHFKGDWHETWHGRQWIALSFIIFFSISLFSVGFSYYMFVRKNK